MVVKCSKRPLGFLYKRGGDTEVPRRICNYQDCVTSLSTKKTEHEDRISDVLRANYKNKIDFLKRKLEQEMETDQVA